MRAVNGRIKDSNRARPLGFVRQRAGLIQQRFRGFRNRLAYRIIVEQRQIDADVPFGGAGRSIGENRSNRQVAVELRVALARKLAKQPQQFNDSVLGFLARR